MKIHHFKVQTRNSICYIQTASMSWVTHHICLYPCAYFFFFLFQYCFNIELFNQLSHPLHFPTQFCYDPLIKHGIKLDAKTGVCQFAACWLASSTAFVTALLDPGGGALSYIGVNMREQKNKEKGVNFSDQQGTYVSCLGVKNRWFSTKRGVFSNSTERVKGHVLENFQINIVHILFSHLTIKTTSFEHLSSSFFLVEKDVTGNSVHLGHCCV